jgi:hypothetical protein
MASIKLISEDEATGKVKDIYDEIKSQLGTDFVPNLYKTMASMPNYLEATSKKKCRNAPRRFAEEERRYHVIE